MTMKLIPKDIYQRCTQIAKSYFSMLDRRSTLEADILLGGSDTLNGMPHGTDTGDPTYRKAEKLIAVKESNERYINAIQQAYEALPDNAAKHFIKQNLFKRIPMEHINSPIPIRTMVRIRREFIINIARNLNEI